MTDFPEAFRFNHKIIYKINLYVLGFSSSSGPKEVMNSIFSTSGDGDRDFDRTGDISFDFSAGAA